MQIRNPFLLTFPAPVFSDIVPRRRTGNQSQIDGNSRFLKLSGNVHCHIVHTADMPQSIERSNVNADPHKLIYIFLLMHSVKGDVLRGVALLINFAVRKKKHGFGRIKRKILVLKGVDAS